MIEIEIGRAKRGRRAYSLDDVAVVPSRRTRDPEEVSLGWQIDAYHFDVPVLAAPMDSVMSPETAIAFGRLGGLPVLDLEGLWTRYEDPEPLLEEIAAIDDAGAATRRMQEIYAEPIKPELIRDRIQQLRDAGVTIILTTHYIEEAEAMADALAAPEAAAGLKARLSRAAPDFGRGSSGAEKEETRR
mgnify:CR=1 FL=1